MSIKTVAKWVCVVTIFLSAGDLLAGRKKNICALATIPQKKTIKSSLDQENNVVCFTMPKGGTHLLIKCLTLFEQPGLSIPYTGRKNNFKPGPSLQAYYDKVNRFDPPRHFKGRFHTPTFGPLPDGLLSQMKVSTKNRLFYSHWPYTKETERFLSPKTTGSFFIIRDPRDMIISMAHMVKDGYYPNQHANVEDLIYDFIDGRQKHFIKWGVEVHDTYPLLWESGVVGFYNLYLPWMKAQKIYTVRFEALVGSKGGGSDDVQYQEIDNIARHIKLTLPKAAIKKVQEQLFGDSFTFREGQIGGWKKTFTPEMKQAFKKAPGAIELLIKLGYEKDGNW